MNIFWGKISALFVVSMYSYADPISPEDAEEYIERDL